MGERSIRATSTATLPWPTMRAVSPDRSGENWERGEKREGSGGGREPGRRREGGREERERGEEREKGRRERGREGEKWEVREGEKSESLCVSYMYHYITD